MSSRRLRGIETSVRVSIDGQVQNTGTWVNITEFTLTERADLNEIDYLGENTSDLDYEHHGFDFSLKADVSDDLALRYLDKIVTRQATAKAHPEIVITVLQKYRTGATVMTVLHDCVMNPKETGFAGRKEAVTVSIDGKARVAKRIDL